jgi:hypothetical protein
MEIVSLGDLETRGFVLVRGFLADDELAALRADYSARPMDQNANYNAKTPTSGAIASFAERIDDVVRQVRERTSIRADVHVPNTSNYFTVGVADGVYFPWHQDHESFYVLQNHFDYLNFYLPIIKPELERSNLCVVPFDVLAEAAPNIHDFVVRSGAGFFRPVAGRTIAVNEDRGTARIAHVDLEALAVTPHLAEGDLLLMRGDIVHRTQDTDTARVALSWRVANGDTVIRRDRLASGCRQKAVMMRKHTAPYHQLFQAFELAGRDELTLREVLDLYATMPPPEPVDAEAFDRELTAERRRAHAVPVYVASYPLDYALKGLNRAQRTSSRVKQLVGN